MTSERAAYMIQLLGQADDYHDPNPGRAHITGLEHALRTAALLDSRGYHPQLPFAGLVHDLARPLNDIHHGEIVAEIVRDRVHPVIYHVLRTHGDYQEAIVHGRPRPTQPIGTLQDCAPYNLQRMALMFAACEALSFDPDYDGPNDWTYASARQQILDYLGE